MGAFALVALLWLAGCAALPGDVVRPTSQALTDVAATPLAREAAAATPDDQRHLSGLRLMPGGPEALATRVDMARNAQKSLDVQYYLIAPDASGRQFLRELRNAAARGVRVRLLVDDLHMTELDALLAGLAAHDNMQVRLFNPLPVRGTAFETRLLLSLHQFSRVNRRMHNKLYIADNTIAITGGRNIADEYFMRSESANFIDMDVLSIGPVVRGLSDVFDRYWNSDHAYPIHTLVAADGTPEALRARFDAWAGAAPTPAQLSAQEPSTPELAQPWLFAPVHVFADEPDKVTGAQVTSGTAMDSTMALMRSARSEVLIVSPYFVPGSRGLELMKEAVDQGVRIGVMTNSLAATDEPLAYWAYARYRPAMLELGVSLTELSPLPYRKFDLLGDLRSSLGRLHAKVTIVDKRWLLVGSMNMDARSARSNTEVGLVIDHAELADEALALMARHWTNSHYRLRMARGSKSVEWLESDEADSAIHHAEPHVGWFKRLRLGVVSMFVAEELL
jgi:cardiolipin synthase C